MRKFIALFFVSVLLLTSCNELSKLTEINLPLSETITIPIIPLVGASSISTPGIKTGIDSIMKDAGISAKSIEDITLNKMEFALTSTDEDFSFFESVDIYMSASGKDDVKIATARDIAVTSKILFKTLDVDLKDYILLEEFSLKIDFETKKPIVSPKEIKIDLNLVLDLKVLGL